MNLLIAIGGAVMLVALLCMIYGYACFSVGNVRKKKYPSESRERDEDQPLALQQARQWYDSRESEAVTLPTRDGLCLRGRLLLAEGEPQGVVLLFHGYHSSPRRDLALQAQALHRAGYHLLLPFQRSHGESEGRYICFGVKERQDAADWCRFAVRRFGDTLPLALLGVSMGASTVLMAVELSLPASVRCLVADCGFTTPWAIIKKRLPQRHKLPAYPTIYFMNAWSRFLADFDYRQLHAAQTLAQSTLPALIIHGDADDYVPLSMAEEIVAARRVGTELLVIPGAPHARAFATQPLRYEEVLLRFLTEHMKR